MNVKKEQDRVEREIRKLGKQLSKPFITRAKELIVQLSKFKGVKIDHLIMGMGGYSLDATVPYVEMFKGEAHHGELDFEFDNFSRRSSWGENFENVNPGICAVVCELDEILEYLTTESYLDIFDIDKDQMKKLLK